jgi:hypothetical protein
MKKLIASALTLFIVSLTFINQSYTYAESSSPSFTDIKGHWAESLINEAVNRGIVSGISSDKFAPNSPLTYEQFMTMLARMFTQYDFITDRISGCKLLLTNYSDEFEASNGDLTKLKEFRENYEKDNPILEDKLVKYSPAHVSSYNKDGECNLRSWTEYNYDTYYTNAPKSKPYQVASHIDINEYASWAKPALTSIPYIAGFLSYYDFVNKESNITDFDYMASKIGVKEQDMTEYYTNEYFKKRINNVYNRLTQRYISYENPNSNKREYPALLREDMALILYSFLNYDEQKLIQYNQDYFYYGQYEHDKNPWRNQDIKYKAFKSSYSDIPKYFQVDSMGYGEYFPDKLRMYYTYRPERVKPNTENFLKLYKEQWEERFGTANKDYEYSTSSSSIDLTSRGIILAVSDAGLLSGSGNKFNPKTALTRAEGVAVALKLDKFIKARYDFSKIDQNDESNVTREEIAHKVLTQFFTGIEQHNQEQVAAVVDSHSIPPGELASLMDNYKHSSFILKIFRAAELPEKNTFRVVSHLLSKTLTDIRLEEYKYFKYIVGANLENINGAWKITKIDITSDGTYTPSNEDVFNQHLFNEKKIIENLIQRNTTYLDKKDTTNYLSTYENPSNESISNEDFTYSIDSITNLQVNGLEATADIQRTKQLVVKRTGNVLMTSDTYRQNLRMSFIKVNEHWKIRNITILNEDKLR